MLIDNMHGKAEFSEDTVFGAHDFVVLQMKRGKQTKFYWLVRKFTDYYQIPKWQAKVLADHVLHMVPELVE